MKFFNYKSLSLLFCLTVIFSNCSNSGSKASTEKADVSTKQVAEPMKIDVSPENIALAEKVNANPEHIALTEKILLYFQQEQFDKIAFYFDDIVKTQIKDGQLSGVWERMNTQIGKYSKSEFSKAENLNDIGDRIVYKCYFDSYEMNFELVINKENRIAGIFFKPV